MKRIRKFAFIFTNMIWATPKRYFAFLVLILAACSKQGPTPSGIVVAMQQMQELATAEYTITKVVKASDDQTWYKIGDRKILITCEAKVKAGIDFSAMDTRYVSIKEKSISIQLPPPKIISVNIPPEKIKVAYQDIGTFRSDFSVSEQNALMVQAEKQVLAKSSQLGILEEAKANTKTWLTGYLSSLGFEQIDIQFDAPIQIQKR
jgi:hypothetical protein